MKSLHFRVSRGLVATATGTLALAGMLAMGLPAPASNSVPGVAGDQPATTQCDNTITGQNNAVIDVASGTTCLVNLNQTGAVNVAPGAALSVTSGSIINGAITLTEASAFTMCDSSTVEGAIDVSSSAGFVLIGDGGDGGLPGCGANHIDGAVTLNGNLGGVEVGGNSIAGALTVSGNIAPAQGSPTEDSATEVEGNTVTGLTTCADNDPAPVNDGVTNTFTGGAGGQCAGL
jgi:hypothetical protein